jgi:hypothetical protein
MAADLRVILVSDGIANAGSRNGWSAFDLAAVAASAGHDASAGAIADRVLDEAVDRDKGKPNDDMSVVALTLPEHRQATLVRRMRAEVPLP